MNAKTQPHDLPEGACLTAKVPDRDQALLGDVVVNPYRLAPLTAIIRDGGRTLSAAHVRVLGRGERGVDIVYDVSDRSLWTYGGIPVFGLYPDHVNQVEVSYKLDGERIRERYEIYAPAVRLPVVATDCRAARGGAGQGRPRFRKAPVPVQSPAGRDPGRARLQVEWPGWRRRVGLGGQQLDRRQQR